MLGIPDFSVWSAYVLCVLSTVLCIVYGAIHWNKGRELESQDIEEEQQWETHQPVE